MVHSLPCVTVCQSFCAGPGFRYIQIVPTPNVLPFSNADYVLTVQCYPCEFCNINNFSCEAGDQIEGEPTCFTGYVDVTNGGPLAVPPSFTPTTCGSAICGTFGLALGLGPYPPYKDQDWYQVTLSQPETLRWCVYARFDPTIAIRGPGGSGYVTYAFSSANAACDTVCVEACLQAGTYWLYVTPTAFYNYLAWCGSRYRAWVECAPCGSGDPTGRCCYCDPRSVSQCAVNTAAQCAALGGEWTTGLTCATPCSSYAQVRFETVPVNVQCVDNVLLPDPFPLGLIVNNYGPTVCNNVVVSVSGGSGPGGTAVILGSPVTFPSLAPLTGSAPNLTAQIIQASPFGGCIHFTATVTSSCCGPDSIAFCIQIPPCDTCDYLNCDRNTEPLNDACGQDHCFVTCGDTLCGTIDLSNNPDWYLFSNPGPGCQQMSIRVFATATSGYFPFGQGLIPSLSVYDASCVFQEASAQGSASQDPQIVNLLPAARSAFDSGNLQCIGAQRRRAVPACALPLYRLCLFMPGDVRGPGSAVHHRRRALSESARSRKRRLQFDSARVSAPPKQCHGEQRLRNRFQQWHGSRYRLVRAHGQLLEQSHPLVGALRVCDPTLRLSSEWTVSQSAARRTGSHVDLRSDSHDQPQSLQSGAVGNVLLFHCPRANAEHTLCGLCFPAANSAVPVGWAGYRPSGKRHSPELAGGPGLE